MKILLAVFAALATWCSVWVASENCHVTSPTTNSCNATTCSVGKVECIEIYSVHLCTCMHINEHAASQTCTLKTDCDSISSFTSTCTNSASRHCVDGACRCQVYGSSHGHGHGHGNN